MVNYKKEVAKNLSQYQEKMKALKLALPGFDAVNAGSRFWRGLTGSYADTGITFKSSGSHPVLCCRVWMNQLNRFGRRVSRFDVNELIEVIDNRLADAGIESEVSSSSSYVLTVELITDNFTIEINSFDGGTCKRKVKKIKTISIPHYEWECD